MRIVGKRRNAGAVGDECWQARNLPVRAPGRVAALLRRRRAAARAPVARSARDVEQEVTVYYYRSLLGITSGHSDFSDFLNDIMPRFSLHFIQRGVPFAMAGRARNYMFTINFGDGDVTTLLPEEFPEWLTYAVWQLEVGDEGTPHYQGYLECSGKRSFAQIHSIPGFERAHLEPRRGTQGQAVAYCTKDDSRVDGPWHHGEAKQQVFLALWRIEWYRGYPLDYSLRVYDWDYFVDVVRCSGETM